MALAPIRSKRPPPGGEAPGWADGGPTLVQSGPACDGICRVCSVCATVSNLPAAHWRRYVDLQGYYNITKIQLYNRYMRGHCGLGGACVGNGAYGAGRRCHMWPLGGLCMVFSLPRMTPDRAAQPRLPVHEPRDMSAPTVVCRVDGGRVDAGASGEWRLTYFEVRAGVVDPSTNNNNVAANELCTSVDLCIQPSFEFACDAGPLAARYVSIQILPNHSGYLTLCEVQVGASNSGAGFIESGAAPSTTVNRSQPCGAHLACRAAASLGAVCGCAHARPSTTSACWRIIAGVRGCTS